jgi:hypothetical protein
MGSGLDLRFNGFYLPFEVWLQHHFFPVIATRRLTADLLLVCAAANYRLTYRLRRSTKVV